MTKAFWLLCGTLRVLQCSINRNVNIMLNETINQNDNNLCQSLIVHCPIWQDRVTNRLSKIQSSSENYLILHKYGHKMEEDEMDDEELVKAFEEYKEKLQTAKLNMKNANLYVECFLQRDDITNKLKNIQDDMLLVAGAKSAYAANMEHMFTFCDKTKTSIIKIDDVGDVLEEAPSKLANSMLLFCKGLGWLTSLTAPGVDRQRSASISSTGSGGGGASGGRRMSMEVRD